MTGLDALEAVVVASGRLAGLLTGSGQDDVAVNVNWFANAESELISVPDRLGQLAVILAELLCEPALAEAQLASASPDPGPDGEVQRGVAGLIGGFHGGLPGRLST